jgi:hypothetical protein
LLGEVFCCCDKVVQNTFYSKIIESLFRMNLKQWRLFFFLATWDVWIYMYDVLNLVELEIRNFEILYDLH